VDAWRQRILQGIRKGVSTMKVKRFLIHFGIAFAVTFVVNAIVVYIYNAITHGEGAFNWETTFRFAITFGILIPILYPLMSKEK
jgi:ATP/ADP translocase